MACGQCSSGGCGNIVKNLDGNSDNKTVSGCGSSGSCGTGGCNKMNAFDWLSNMDTPVNERYDVIEIKFKGGRKEYFRNKNTLDLYTGDFVVCEMPTGYHIGSVSLQGELVRLQMLKRNIKDNKEIVNILRLATEKDLEKHSQAINRDLIAMFRTREICKELKLNLKLSEVEFQSDNSKATFYYSADDRVDFRELIKRLAGEFKVRVEMRQISLRQEAGRLGGIGSCGRELCCSTWLSDFKAIPTAAARYQNLSLNPAKLSGQCGRLKCCLNYELETYIDAIRDMPTVEKPLKTEKGDAYLQKTDIFRRIMWFSYPNDSNWLPIASSQVIEIQKMNKEGKKPVDLENLIEMSEMELTKPTSINTDLEKLDKKYHQKKKSTKSRKNKNKPTNERTNPEVKPVEQKTNESTASITENNNPNRPSRPQRSRPRPARNNENNAPAQNTNQNNGPKAGTNTTQNSAPKPEQNTTQNNGPKSEVNPNQATGMESPSKSQNNKNRRKNNRNRPPKDSNNTPS